MTECASPGSDSAPPLPFRPAAGPPDAVRLADPAVGVRPAAGPPDAVRPADPAVGVRPADPPDAVRPADPAVGVRPAADPAVDEPGPAPGDRPIRLTAFVHGQVQGVGFRWWTRARALELGLSGSATNLADGRVQVIAEGGRAQCGALVELLRGGRTPGAVALVVEHYGTARGESGFLER